ncbi:MAG TPA: tRNA (N(6)-L-threonylcarbamoyladenosine(37)-C(2))-methylthiotransferase MtaB [Vicinamibacterales bacterium]|nr:tRNA (N(6)-L-threonylcarbamoyladenosine(37)-C(2))-methylthiotransferase MtaB [Vicinamibacterales bacterium]
MIRYSIVTFGCRVNQADSLHLEEDLLDRGGIPVQSNQADVVVVNTCSVTSTADQGARQAIRRIARDNPLAKVVVTGCYATRCPDDVASLPGVVQIVRNDRKDRLVDEMASVVEQIEHSTDSHVGSLTTAERFAEGDGSCGAAVQPGIAGRTAFTLRVQTGCEERCSYCIIPATRGAGRSTPIRDIMREVERVAHAGFKDVAITGVHLGSYGRDLSPASSLIDLLRGLNEIPADVVFRISSLEPMDCSPAIVDLVATSGGRFAPHFHLPLQHASDRVLARMRRPYTLAYYRRLVDDIVSRLPEASIGSDMIVGFPGESDPEFDANLAYLPSAPLSHLHVFPYSDRPGTEAARMPDRVHGSVIRERASALRAIGAELSSRFRSRQLGTLRPGLTLEDGTLVVTDNYLKVRIPPGLPRNQRVLIRIDSTNEPLQGHVID